MLHRRLADVEPLTAGDIANAILFALGAAAAVSVNEVLVRPSSQR